MTPILARSHRANSRRSSRATHPLWFIAPAFVCLALFFFLPTLYNFYYAFTNWSGFSDEIRFIGVRNFAAVISDGSLFASLRITLVYAALVAVMQNLFGLGLALLLEEDRRINRLLRVFFFIPVLMSALAVGYIFQALLKPTGAVNGLLGVLSGQAVTIPWLGSTTFTIIVVAFVNSWKWMGLSMLIYLAGLKTIPGDAIEAARIDGAGRIEMFRSIKFPLLAPAVTFNVATALLGSLNGFDTVQATTQGGPAQTTEVLNIFIFNNFGHGLYAQATAMSLVLFLVVTLLAFPVIASLRRREDVL